jgi:O-antigen/teichoic acid export membrane protein
MKLAVPTVRQALFASRLWVPGRILQLAGSSALRDATTLGAGTLLSQAILVFAAPVFLRLYRPADFGLYSFAYGMIGLAATIGSWKIERLIVVVPARATAVRLLAALVLIAGVTAASFLILAFLSAAGGLLSKIPSEGLALLLPTPPSMFVLVVSAGFRNYCIRLGRFKAVAAAQISRTIVFVTGTVATAIGWTGLEGHGALIMISWQVVADAAALLVQIGANSQAARLILFRPRLRESLTVLKTHRKTLGTLTLSQIIEAVNQQIRISTVTLAFGALQAGWFSLGNQFVSAPTTIITVSVRAVANRRFARLHAQASPFSHLVLWTTLGMALAGIVPFAAIIFLGPKLLPFIFGPSWIGASQSVSLHAIASYLFFVVAPAETVALIVEARGYIILWYSLNMAILVGFGAAALSGWISYHVWLTLVVAGDVFLYILTAVSGYLFARRAESRWCQCRTAAAAGA